MSRTVSRIAQRATTSVRVIGMNTAAINTMTIPPRAIELIHGTGYDRPFKRRPIPPLPAVVSGVVLGQRQVRPSRDGLKVLLVAALPLAGDVSGVGVDRDDSFHASTCSGIRAGSRLSSSARSSLRSVMDSTTASGS